MTALSIRIFKTPLRPGLSYPIRPAALAEALRVSEIQTSATLFQRTEIWWTCGVLFRADFYPVGALLNGYHGNLEEVLHLTCRSVPSQERQAAMAFLNEEVIPAMVTWVMGLEKLPRNSTMRREQQSFTREWCPPSVTP